jgi:hypothetical protein
VDAGFIGLMKKNRAFYSATHTVFEASGDLAGWSRRLQEFDESHARSTCGIPPPLPL